MSVKKAELHVHLEGTISPELARKLALRNRLPFPEQLIASDGKSYASNGFLDFLKAYDTLADLIKCPQDYYDITFDYLKSNALENTLYTEMMYSPDHAEKSSGIPSREHLQAIAQAIKDAEEQFDIVGRVIITAVRHFGVESAIKVAAQGIKDKLPCVTGFGLGGDEAKFPPELFCKAYQIAAEGGLQCTIHAGEFAPAHTMMAAIKHLPIQRIGHGVMAIHCAETRAMLKDHNIALEICPSSNIFLGLFKDMESHPLPQFLEEGIKVSINSDDPPFMNTNLGQEYRKVQKAYGYNDKTMQDITAMAINCAFVDENTKEKLKAKITKSNSKD